MQLMKSRGCALVNFHQSPEALLDYAVNRPRDVYGNTGRRCAFRCRAGELIVIRSFVNSVLKYQIPSRPSESLKR